ncbi:hypothetical protein [Streptomyces sp. NPDC020965]|uniref:hypothetical protein n=1 Tax=Streptomyces sp. NPDC020965 TaxID=3365105 RepID=UPI003790E2CE
MNDSTPSGSAPEDGEPPSYVEKTKRWYTKRKPQIHAFAGAVGALGAIALTIAPASPAEREDNEKHDADDIADSEQTPGDEAKSEPRGASSPHVRKLPSGWNPSEEKKTQHKAETGEDLPPGTTYVHRVEDEDEDEDPGEAAA